MLARDLLSSDPQLSKPKSLTKMMVKKYVWWLPAVPLLLLWASHLYFSCTLHPDVLWNDDWSVFRIAG